MTFGRFDLFVHWFWPRWERRWLYWGREEVPPFTIEPLDAARPAKIQARPDMPIITLDFPVKWPRVFHYALTIGPIFLHLMVKEKTSCSNG